MKHQHQQPGFVLVLAVCIIGLMSTLIMRTVVRLTLFSTACTVVAQREQAKLLAWSGIEIAIAQICAEEQTKPHKQTASTQASQDAADRTDTMQKFRIALKKFTAILNRWQRIPLTEAHDGIDGTCTIYISCESGKIPLCSALTRPRPPELLALYTSIDKTLGKHIQHSNFATNIDQLLKKMEESPSHHKLSPLQDVSDLLTLPMFKLLEHQLFLTPSTTFALTDLFTAEITDSSMPELMACTLSKSVAALYGLSPQHPIPKERWRKFAEQLPNTATKANLVNAELELIYGTIPSAVSAELVSMLSEKFEPDYFSVISYGTYARTTVMLHAIIRKKEIIQKDGKKQPFGCITKVYWIYE